MKLGMQIGLGPGHIVLDEDPVIGRAAITLGIGPHSSYI